ncbi:unnamed protein product [Lactuca saligna]|uniref:Uncharacterized protein n=1 Tax=Lactuca saligna TaxID=75948 RepID=A0AA35YG59_LACSI|nr:unnamed protein product [Lactuca saligna]
MGLLLKLDTRPYTRYEAGATDPIHDIKSKQLVEQISSKLNKDHVQPQYGSNDEAVRTSQRERVGREEQDFGCNELKRMNKEENVLIWCRPYTQYDAGAIDPIHYMKSEQLVEQISGKLNKDHVQAQYGSNDEVVRTSQRERVGREEQDSGCNELKRMNKE